MAARDRTNPGGEEFVPKSFEDEHLEEARRMVAASHRRWASLRPRWAPTRVRGPRQRLGRLLALGHAFIACIVVAFAAVTDTWLIGAGMLGLAVVSYGISRHLLIRSPRFARDAGPGRGLDDRASRKP